jgi:hypothetical protein
MPTRAATTKGQRTQWCQSLSLKGLNLALWAGFEVGRAMAGAETVFTEFNSQQRQSLQSIG